jgi:hypothetical protein
VPHQRNTHHRQIQRDDEEEKVNKYEKIMYLQNMGLNTTKLFLLAKGDEAKWNQAVAFIGENNGASIRTFGSDDAILTPHKPNLDKEAAILSARDFMQQYNVILTERVNPDFAIASGKATVIKADGEMRPTMSFEFSIGKGAVVRDVDKKAPSELLRFSIMAAIEIDVAAPTFQDRVFKLKDGSDWHFDSESLEAFCTGVREACVQMISTKMMNHCFELSIYSKDIGIRNRPVIFWETYQVNDLSKV